ncbi:MAG: anaerobic ribonucleoside-triphosphate reductase, partial [Candidatus Helarchaeota archaeon]
SYISMGSLQSVSLNLPRYAYMANGNDDKLFEIIMEKAQIAKAILLKKRDIIKHRLEKELLPLCSRKAPDQDATLLDLRRQSLSLGFIGLNECVLSHTGFELHENDGAFEFGKKILKNLSRLCEKFTSDTGYKFSLWEQPAESASTRFALLDLKHFPDKARVQGTGRAVYYTNSDHVRYSADISLMDRILKQAEYHPIVQGGVMTHIWLGESNPEKEALWKFTKNIALNTDTAYFAFTKDFTNCLNCKKFSAGIYTKCPHCGASEAKLEWYSRITGYYSRLNSWNDGKIQEWRDRKRYNLEKL